MYAKSPYVSINPWLSRPLVYLWPFQLYAVADATTNEATSQKRRLLSDRLDSRTFTSTK